MLETIQTCTLLAAAGCFLVQAILYGKGMHSRGRLALPLLCLGLSCGLYAMGLYAAHTAQDGWTGVGYTLLALYPLVPLGGCLLGALAGRLWHRLRR